MTLTRRITDIQCPAVRAPLWTVYFTLYLLPDMIISAWLDGHAGLLFSRRPWALAWSVFLVGIDGTKNYFEDEL